jgi:hypothetical protein
MELFQWSQKCLLDQQLLQVTTRFPADIACTCRDPAMSDENYYFKDPFTSLVWSRRRMVPDT